MVSPSAGSVVLVTFPFSDLSAAKLRPAVVLATAGRGDWILCQVTSNPYADPDAVRIEDEDFSTGSLNRVSFARPGKLFTANTALITAEVGHLRSATLAKLLDGVTALLKVTRRENSTGSC